MDDEKAGGEETVLENVDSVERSTGKEENLENSPNLTETEGNKSPSTPQEEEESKVPQVEQVENRQVESEKGDQSGQPAAPAPTEVVKSKDKDKINILLKAVGDAPILKQKLWSVPADREVSQIIEFVKKYLKLEKHQSLFLFVNQSFAPTPDQPLKELYECFGSDGKIVLHYSTTYAWG